MDKMTANELILASSSPRRIDILRSLGLRAAIEPIAVDEAWIPGEQPEVYVQRLAREKAMARASRPGAESCDASWVLAADTAVVLDRKILGKPKDRSDGVAMLLRLGGRTHTVVTGVAVCRKARTTTTLSQTEVTMRALTQAEAEAYWVTGEPRDKAGAYALQGLGAIFVEEIRGSYSGVVGLPIFETAQLLRDRGFYLLSGAPHGTGHA